MAEQTTRPTQQNTIDLINDTVLPIINELDKKVDLLGKDVQYLKDGTEARLTAAEKIVDMLRKEMYGNGNPSEYLGMKATMLSMKKWIDERNSIERAVIIGAILALIGEIAGFIFLAVRISTLAA